MATYTDVTFKVNDEHLQRFIDGIAAHYGYQEMEGGEPNPESKAQYGKRKIRQEWIQRVKRQERLEAERLIDVEPIEVT